MFSLFVFIGLIIIVTTLLGFMLSRQFGDKVERWFEDLLQPFKEDKK